MFVENCNKCQHGLKCPCGNSLHSAACLNIAKGGEPRQTNADKIRAMNDEELAELFAQYFCEDADYTSLLPIKECKWGTKQEVINRNLKWLQSEAEC